MPAVPHSAGLIVPSSTAPSPGWPEFWMELRTRVSASAGNLAGAGDRSVLEARPDRVRPERVVLQQAPTSARSPRAARDDPRRAIELRVEQPPRRLLDPVEQRLAVRACPDP